MIQCVGPYILQVFNGIQVNQLSPADLIIILIQCEDIALHAWYTYYYASATWTVGCVGSAFVSASVVNVLIASLFCGS